MNFTQLDAKKIVVIIAVVAIPLLTINVERNPEQSHWSLKPFAFALGSLQSLFSDFSSGVRGTTALYLDLIDIKVQNKSLLEENAELRAKLGALTELKMENERLNGLLGFKQKSKMEMVTAKVIGKDLLPDHNTLTINRGSNHGIRKHMATITVGGVVGYVFRTSLFTSQILLLTDRYAAIDSIVQRSRARGIVEGNDNDHGLLKYLKRDDDVKVGDLIVTSGLDNIFPKGFPVGTVKNVTKSEYGLSQDVELQPTVTPQTLEEVFVVVNTNQEDFSPPEEGEEKEEQQPAAEEVTEEPKPVADEAEQ